MDFFRRGFVDEPVATDDPGAAPQADLEDEASYWRGRVREIARAKGTQFDYMLDPARQIQEPFRTLLSRNLPDENRPLGVLDVGCGPLSVLGKRLDDRAVSVLGVDPLADVYAEIVAENDLVRPFEAIAGGGEALADLVAPRSFDMVFSRNALDHSRDPGLVIRQMLRACRPGGYVVFEVYRNEAVTAAYTGLHQWNFDCFNDRVVLWNPGQIVLLDSIVGGLPYRVDVGTTRADGKEKTILTVTVKVLSLDAFTDVGEGVAMHVSQDDGFVTVRDAGGDGGRFDSALACFLHEVVQGRNVAGQVFRWYAHMPTRSLKLASGQAERLRIGQFDSTIEDPKARNLWSATIDCAAPVAA
jgi:SAM-dependent methyltransferase